MKSASRRCSNCRKKVATDDAIVSSLKAFCCYECLKEYTEKHREAIQKAVVKEKRQETRVRKEKLKSRSEWLREAQKAFNAYVRWRDRNEACVSCGNYTIGDVPGGGWDAGHYRSTGSAPHLRFNLWNCHKQCVKCNRYLSGNVAEYRIGLIRKIGIKKVEMLEAMTESKNYSIDDLKRIKNIFKKRNKKC